MNIHCIWLSKLITQKKATLCLLRNKTSSLVYRQEFHIRFELLRCQPYLTWGGGGMMAPQNVFDHCAQTLRKGKLKQFFCYHCVEYIKLDICGTFHDHRSNNNKVMIGGKGGGGGWGDLMLPHNWRFKKAHVK